jgi:hypothetical protein
MTVFDDKGVLMIKMSRQEALETIRSLSEQMARNNPNTNRYEKFLDDGRDFSISVQDKGD